MTTVMHKWLLTCLLCLIGSTACAAVKTPEDAVAMVKKVIAYLHKNGPEKTFAEINDPKGQFVDGELYAFAFRADGQCLAHGASPNLIGKNLNNLRDPDGVAPVQEIIRIGKTREGKGWIVYRWPHSQTHKIEPKRSYVERDGDLLIGAGIANDNDKP